MMMMMMIIIFIIIIIITMKVFNSDKWLPYGATLNHHFHLKTILIRPGSNVEIFMYRT